MKIRLKFQNIENQFNDISELSNRLDDLYKRCYVVGYSSPSFLNCAHTSFDCRCFKRYVLNCALKAWHSNVQTLTKEEMRELVTLEYSFPMYEIDNLQLIEILEKHNLL